MRSEAGPVAKTRALRWNVVANVAGSIWSGLIGLAFIPFYIRYLGVEAYGLIGLFVTIQAISVLLDAGLSVTLNREVARLTGSRAGPGEIRNLVRTIEIVYWGVALGMGVALVLGATLISQHWVQAEHLSHETVRSAIVLMGLSLAAQWPGSLYMGGLQGLQRQVELNLITAALGTVRGVGAVLVLALYSPTLEAFFSWQILMSLLQTFLLMAFLWSCLPPSEQRPAFRSSVFRQIGHFAAGMSGITVLALLLSQLDKVLLSRMLSLEMFGYYIVAATVASGLGRVIAPLFTAFFPRFSELVGKGDEETLRHLYHRACQLVSVVVIPIAVVLALFSEVILSLWLGDDMVVRQTHLLVSLLVVGTALNGLMNIPYALQLAYGWTRLTLMTNLVAVVILVPAVIVATSVWGAVGAAWIWISLNLGYVLISIPLMHRRLLSRDDMRRWYLEDVGMPLVASVGVALLARAFVETNGSSLVTVVKIIVIAFAILVAAGATIGWLREAAVLALRRLRPRLRYR